MLSGVTTRKTSDVSFCKFLSGLSLHGQSWGVSAHTVPVLNCFGWINFREHREKWNEAAFTTADCRVGRQWTADRQDFRSSTAPCGTHLLIVWGYVGEYGILALTDYMPKWGTWSVTRMKILAVCWLLFIASRLYFAFTHLLFLIIDILPLYRCNCLSFSWVFIVLGCPWALLFLSATEMAALALLVLLVTTILHYRLLNVMKIMWVWGV